jgi:two-component system LytT family response regulator
MLSRNSLPELRVDLDEADAAASVESPSSAPSPLRLVETDAIPSDPQLLRPLVEQLIAELRSQRRRNARVVVKTGGKVLFLRAEEIEWVEAAGNYVRLHVRGESFLYRESMKNMEARLDHDLFVRIHRSAIINVDRIRELQPWFHGEYVVILHDGTRLMASRVFSDRLDRLIA